MTHETGRCRWGAGPFVFEVQSSDPTVLAECRRVFACWPAAEHAAPWKSWAVRVEHGVPIIMPPIVHNDRPPEERAHDDRPWTLGRAMSALEYGAIGEIYGSSTLCFHGALVARGGHGVVIVGPSHSGKSTLGCALWQDGWTLLCDDLTMVVDGQVCPTPRRVSLRLASRALIGDEAWNAVASTAGFAETSEGCLFQPRDLTLDRTTGVDLRAIVFLHRRGVDLPPAAVGRLSSAQAAMALLPYANLVRRLSFPDALAPVSRLMSAVPAWDLGRGELPAMVEAVGRVAGRSRVTTLHQAAAPRLVALMITRRCNMSCAHCSVESGPGIRTEPSDAHLQKTVAALAAAGVGGVVITGGEPMLRSDIVLRLMRTLRRAGLSTVLQTNGFWARTYPAARATLSALQHAGLSSLTLSYDRYHAAFQGPDRCRHVARAAEALGVPLNVNITRVRDDEDIADLLAPFDGSPDAHLRFYDVQPVGRARDMDRGALRGELGGYCRAAEVPSITDDGRMVACNGPAYFLPDDSPLSIGRLRDHSVTELLARHRDDPILDTIRTCGPERLRAELEHLPGQAGFRPRDRYAGICDLCVHINADARVAAALRTRLAEPRLVAERAARRLVIDRERQRGRLGREYANGPGAARAWLEWAATSHTSDRSWTALAEPVFNRADFDWRHAAGYLAACGLARVLCPAATALSRWAPSAFGARLGAAARSEALRELVQIDALHLLCEELSTLGARGVLLKGGALLGRALDRRASGAPAAFPGRSAGDIDLHVAQPAATELRARLLRAGFGGHPSDRRTGPHHLAPVVFRGVSVEIHTRIMPTAWRLPELAMLDRSHPLATLPGLATLDREGLLLHALMHTAAHTFSHGLRAAWDVAGLFADGQAIDGDRVAQWVSSCAVPAGFYIPARVLRRHLQLPIPPQALWLDRKTPREATLERAVAWRLFAAMEGAYELNPFTKHAFVLALHSSWRGRAAHLARLLAPDERESRASAATRAGRRADGARGVSRLIQHLRETMGDFRAYRDVLQRMAREETAHAGESFD